MLVLTRRPGERLTIHTSDGDIIVNVFDVAGEYEGRKIAPRVRIGIEAPASVFIERDDIKEAKSS